MNFHLITELLKYVDLTKFDLIISEVYLEKKNVDYLIHHLKENKINQKLIIISEFLVDNELIKYFSDADDYMKKPINFLELKIRIDKVLSCKKF